MSNLEDIFKSNSYNNLKSSLIDFLTELDRFTPMTGYTKGKLNEMLNRVNNFENNLDFELSLKHYKETGECDHHIKYDKYTGSDSHNSYYDIICKVCGKTLKEDVKG